MRPVLLRALLPVVSVLALALTPSAAGASPQVVPISPAGTSYGYSSVDPAGNLWFPDYYNSTVTRLSPSGATSVFSVPSPWALTTDTSGNAYVVDWGDNRLYEITAGGTVNLLASGSPWSSVYGIAVDPAGGFYVSNYAGVKHVTISGVVTPLSSDGGYGLKLDAAGNLYTSDNAFPATIYRISPSGTATPVASSSLLDGAYDVAIASDGTLYSVNSNGDVVAVSPSGAISIVVPASAFPTSATGSSGSVAVGPDGRIYVSMWGDNSEYALSPASPLSVHVARSAASLSATWSGGTGPFICTLMYGFNSPSTFTIRTTSSSCTFYNLASDTPYGVRVSTLGGQGTSAVAMAGALATTITCTRDRLVRHVTGTDPRCPAGWRRR